MTTLPLSFQPTRNNTPIEVDATAVARELGLAVAAFR